MLEEEMIKEVAKEIKEKFNKIEKQGYIKSTSIGRGNIGLTLETLLGKENDNFQTADYEGIEIKAKHGYSKTYITLFSLVPSGESFFETKRIRENFGWYDEEYPDIKVFTKSSWARYKNKLPNKLKLSHIVDYDKKRIYLCFYDQKNKLIDKKTYWDFDDLKKTLYRKMKYLAFCKAWPKRANGTTYFRYYDLKFYKLKSFEEFIKLLDYRYIRIDIQQGIFRSGKHIGKPHDRGITFGIKECDLLLLYDEFKI